MSLTVTHRNEVILVGRVETDPVTRDVPVGRTSISWRLAVQRPAAVASPGDERDVGPGRARRPVADSIDCVVVSTGVRNRVARWEVGDVVEVAGALRRRFWRSADGVRSRYEVEVTRARRVSRVRRDLPA